MVNVVWEGRRGGEHVLLLHVRLCSLIVPGESMTPHPGDATDALDVVDLVRTNSVGIGDSEDFTPMKELDGDEVRIANSSGKKASRDIVQFVPMCDFRDKGFHSLAREVGISEVVNRGWPNEMSRLVVSCCTGKQGTMDYLCRCVQ